MKSQLVAEIGSRITREGLPIVAIVVVSANAPELGILAALSTLPALVLGNLFGSLVDRHPRRALLMVGNLGRGLVLLLIPILYLLHRLTFFGIAVVMAVSSMCSLLMAISRHAYLPELVSRARLEEGNDLLGSAESVGETVGPGVMGVLIATVGAPLTIVFDAGANFLSLLVLAGVRHSTAAESPVLNHSHDPSPPGITEVAWRKVFTHPVLKNLALSQASRALAGGFFAALYELYVLRTVHLSPFFLGLLITSGGVGSLLATRWLSRLRRKVAMGTLMWLGALLAALLTLAVPLARGAFWAAFPLLFVGQFGGDMCASASEITQVTVEQQVTPDHWLGRVNGTLRSLNGGTEVLGALVAGPLALVLSVRLTLYLADGALMLSALLLMSQAIRGYRPDALK